MPTLTAQPSFDLLSEEINNSKEKQQQTRTTTATEEISNEIFNGGATTGQLTVAVTPSSAFQVINQDNLGQIAKPNAIVRPVRRAEPINGQKSVVEDEELKKSQELEKFAQELDIRLRRLKNENKKKHDKTEMNGTVGPTTTVKNVFHFFGGLKKGLKGSSMQLQSGGGGGGGNSNNQDSCNKRPLFITTVPTGVFLQPIKEHVVPVKRVYAYASRPRIFTNRNSNNKNQNIGGSGHHVDKELTATITGIKLFTNNLVFSNNGTKTREKPPEPYKNIMFDRRIVRGSNYTSNHLMAPWNPYFAYAGLLSGKVGKGDSEIVHKDAEARRRQLLRKRCLTKNQRGILGTPPPIPGRKHEDVQTEKYLEELFERPPEADANVQTDLFLQRPPSPPYVPGKIGVDVATEILDGELFNFDVEVQPILETLVGHTVEQGLIEVLHEEEIADLKKQQEQFLAIREADLSELRRLEAEELRLEAEKERRLRQDQITKELDEQMQERVTAAKLLQGHIANLLPGILGSLEPLSDAADKEELERSLCPWLTKEVSEELGRIIDSREILIEIIKEIVKDRATIYANYKEPEAEEVEEEEGEGEQSIPKELEEEQDDSSKLCDI